MHVVAVSKPTERESTQWYFQRYVAHLPSAGELVLFDRSWYNRAGVEKVMGFCSDEEYTRFLKEVPLVERLIRHLLAQVPDTNITPDPVSLPSFTGKPAKERHRVIKPVE